MKVFSQFQGVFGKVHCQPPLLCFFLELSSEGLHELGAFWSKFRDGIGLAACRRLVGWRFEAENRGGDRA